MAFNLLDWKEKTRRTLHRVLAVSSFYENDDKPPTEIPMRWHNKLARNGSADDGFDIDIIEGIDRVVFQEPDLLAAGIDPNAMQRGDRVTMMHKGQPLAVFKLEAREPGDGPLNIYWSVSRWTAEDDGD